MANIVTVAEALGYLQLSVDPDGFLAARIPEVSAAIEKHCRRRFQSADGVTPTQFIEYQDGDQVNLLLAQRPVSTVDEVRDTVDDTVVAATEYSFDPEAAMLFLKEDTTLASAVGVAPPKWGRGRRRWKVTYKGGTAAAPADVKLACLKTLAMLFSRRDPSVVSVTLGDLSTTYEVGKSGLPKDVERDLVGYVERGF